MNEEKEPQSQQSILFDTKFFCHLQVNILFEIVDFFFEFRLTMRMRLRIMINGTFARYYTYIRFSFANYNKWKNILIGCCLVATSKQMLY